MDTLAPRPDLATLPQSCAAEASAPTRKTRLAIVSTTNKLCGIAAYTAALERQLATAFDLTIFDLDQYLLRGRQPRLRGLADRHIRELCEELKGFDWVNLQLEYGTLGCSPRDIYRRFCWLVAAAPRLSVTFHTLVPSPNFSAAAFAGAILGGNLRDAARMPTEFRRNSILSSKVAGRLRQAQRTKPVAAIVHSRRSFREVRYLYGLDHVFDHPLVFLSAAEAAAIRARATRRHFPMLDRVPDDAVLVGVFGFLSDYKGVGTAVRALRHLPENHHLLIFGGIHPNEIAASRAMHPYLERLFEEARIDATPYDRLNDLSSDDAPRLTLDVNRGLAELLGPDPHDLSSRIHFMGAASDEDFLHGMAVCDVVVLPYLEVGQSGSGPISQALELGCRIVASRTHTFLGFADYHREAIEFFDIGNYVELAQRIQARRQFPPRDPMSAHNCETNKAIYLAANGPLPAGISVSAGSTAPVRAVRVR